MGRLDHTPVRVHIDQCRANKHIGPETGFDRKAMHLLAHRQGGDAGAGLDDKGQGVATRPRGAPVHEVEQMERLIVEPGLGVALEHDVPKNGVGEENSVEPSAGEVRISHLEGAGSDLGGEE